MKIYNKLVPKLKRKMGRYILHRKKMRANILIAMQYINCKKKTDYIMQRKKKRNFQPLTVAKTVTLLN